MKVNDKIKVPIPRGMDVICESRKGLTYKIVKYTQSKKYDRAKQHYTYDRITIGHTCSDTEMHPNANYETIFKGSWEQATGREVSATSKRFGLFSICQAINEKIGIKDVLDVSFGEHKSNMIVDYSMFSILHHSNVAAAFEESMRDQMLYCSKVYSDSTYGKLFKSDMSKEEILTFRKNWAIQCKKDGVDSVWICIDGSNDECESTGVEIAEKGHNKTGKNKKIVSFTYAVTQDGKPVTYDLYPGGLVDSIGMKKVIDFLKECEINIEGVILDRGYCTSRALRYLSEQKIRYIIMVKGTPQGYSDLFASDSETIRMNMDYHVDGSLLFGIQKKLQLFKDYPKEDYITLFYDFVNASGRVAALLNKVNRERKRIETEIAAGNNHPEVAPEFSKLMKIEPTKIGSKTIPSLRYTDEMQKQVNEKGYYSILSSDIMTPAEIHAHYSSRNASETQYMFVKGQLGYGKVRVRNTLSVHSRFTVGFVAAVIRFEVEQAARSMHCDTNQIIREINQYEMIKLNSVYTYSHAEKRRIMDLFSILGTDLGKILDDTVKAENDRVKGISPTLRHRKTGPRKTTSRKKASSTPSKPGPKPGYKHGELNADGTARKKPGVKKGTKRGEFNKDGSPRKKPGPRPGSSRKSAQTA